MSQLFKHGFYIQFIWTLDFNTVGYTTILQHCLFSIYEYGVVQCITNCGIS